MQTKSNHGFTLVEVLIISPIVILMIGTFIGLAVGLTGESLVLREKNGTAYNVQAALDDMENTVIQSTGFLVTTSSIPTPQGKDDATANFTNEVPSQPDTLDTLIVKSATTSANPSSANRTLIYTGTSPCDSRNAVYQSTIIYFVSGGSLYKRTILPISSACATPWQRNSCSTAAKSSNSTRCKAEDEKLLDNVTSVAIKYYAASDTAVGSETADSNASTANTVSIAITTSAQAAGQSINYSGSMRVTSLNYQKVDTSASPSPPTSTGTISASNNINTPYTTTFSWDCLGNATGYNIEYRIGGIGAWTTGPQNYSCTTYDVPGTFRKQQIEIRLTAISNTGNFPYPNGSSDGSYSMNIARWNSCPGFGASTPGNWTNYGYGFNNMGFTRTSSGLVGLRGLVMGGNIGYFSDNRYPVCTLPVGFRPSGRLIFQVQANGRGRIDIDVDGTVSVVERSASTEGWASLDGIIFPASGALTWTNATLQNSWTYSNYGGEDYVTPQYGKDSLGRVHVQGLGTEGNYAYPITTTTLPVGYRPDKYMHVGASSAASNAVSLDAGGNIQNRGIGGSYRSLQMIFQPSSFTTWTSLGFASPWANYDTTTYSPYQCDRGSDDVVIMRGLIKGGTSGTTISFANCGTAADGTQLFAAWMNPDQLARIDMGPAGNVIGQTVNSTWTALDGIHYIAD